MWNPAKALADLPRDVTVLFVGRGVRLFAYGLLSVVLVLYLLESGLSDVRVGLLLTLTLVGDTVLSLWITTHADAIGRRRMLVLGALLMVGAGLAFASTRSFPVLLVAATVGILSPSGNEVGPFLAIEQAALADGVPFARRPAVFAWYNLLGSFATAFGALAGGALAQLARSRGADTLTSDRVVVVAYAFLGLVLALVFQRLSSAVEALEAQRSVRRPAFLDAGLGLGPSRGVVLRLSALFSLDAFAGGFIAQSFVAYWFHARFGVDLDALGTIFFAANVLAGISALLATRLAQRIGLLETMVLTHLPSNVLLLLVPLMPSLPLAIAVLLARFSISQMDVPARQAYTMALVAPAERSAAAGVTGIARTLGAALAPAVASPLYATAALASLPFFVCGGLKIVYDLAVWRTFRRVRLPEA